MDGEEGAWRILHRDVTESTNADALAGRPGDVFTADLQLAGRGRLDHRWLSPAGANLMMSAVVGVGGMPPEEVAALPIVAGLAVARAVAGLLGAGGDGLVRIKWPNDILVGGRKVCGILCERSGDCAVVGVGVNVNQTSFAPEISARATSVALELARLRGLRDAPATPVARARDAVLSRLGEALRAWRVDGFAGLWPEVSRLDFLKGKSVSVSRTDGDDEPVRGACGGILADGSLDVGGVAVYAGEAHVRSVD